MPFRAVNRRGWPGHDPGLQRHHLLPRELLTHSAFRRMFMQGSAKRRSFDDFRDNGLLLPCRESAALRMGLPLHRGPHRHYNAMVIERVGQIEGEWTTLRPRDDAAAAAQVQWRLALLQRALRRFLLDGRRRRLLLNRQDPLGAGINYSDLDVVAEALWGASGSPHRDKEAA
ncbi:AHH domain-containing protein [Novosphingobium malaysiense]|uniref:AHH domain-containing protein n=1 Tax=Novosphingobium malaysiense TaxID=1348853 RepID=UPI0009DD446B|nr:AHH domain-containing protein [Novosphingobium malaysiense]